MSELAAFHVRGRKVHARPDCVRSARPVTLTGPYLPVAADGTRETWRTCPSCGHDLVADYAALVSGQPSPWLLATYGINENTPSWQVRRRHQVARMVTDLKDRGLPVTVARHTLTDVDGDFAAVVSLPRQVVAVMDDLMRCYPLPARAVEQQAADASGFATLAEVFIRLVGDHLPALHDPAAGSPDALAAWAEGHWGAAEAVLAPAAP